MTEKDKSIAAATNKQITLRELITLLRNPPSEVIQNSGEEATILLKRYTIEDEPIILDDRIVVDQKLTFQYCTFKGANSLIIDGIVCNDNVTFDGCEFSEGIYFLGGTFKKELCLKYVHLKHIHLLGGTFDKISISAYDMEEISLSGAKFEHLFIGEYLVNVHINKLLIFGKSDGVGNINVREKLSFDKIFLSGTNKNRRFNFEEIRCNSVSIIDFTNEGSLNFYGIEPIDFNNDIRHFQIVNSNLQAAQFFRVHFANYKELIIIDSFITDVLFINCQWRANIRALKGPGYEVFEKSLETGRKISKIESFAIKEAYRQLKISMFKHVDKIQESKFYAEELTFHNKTLGWTWPCKNLFWDKIILGWSRRFSDYGQSFAKPFGWLLLGHLILFIVALLLNGYTPLHISLSNPTARGFEEAFEKYFIYINPLRKFEISLSGYLILLDFFMRIWSSYMLYSIIRASRRFIS